MLVIRSSIPPFNPGIGLSPSEFPPIPLNPFTPFMSFIPPNSLLAPTSFISFISLKAFIPFIPIKFELAPFITPGGGFPKTLIGGGTGVTTFCRWAGDLIICSVIWEPKGSWGIVSASGAKFIFGSAKLFITGMLYLL